MIRTATKKTTFAPDAIELQELSAQPTRLVLPRAAAFLADLVQDRSFLRAHVLSLLEEAQDAERWYVARRWDAPDGSFSLQVFVWPPGTRTMIHDHSSWGAYACAAGTVLEERYERLDDGSRHEHARLEEAWRLSWSPQDGASTVLPGNGGIHRVGNPHEETAVSVHLYGPRLEEVDGRDYDPSCDYVCDRLAESEEPDGTVVQDWPVHGHREGRRVANGQPGTHSSHAFSEFSRFFGFERFRERLREHFREHPPTRVHSTRRLGAIRRRSDMGVPNGAEAEVDRGRNEGTN